MVVGISLGYLPDRSSQTRELRQLLVSHTPGAIFKFFERLPGPGVAKSRRGVTNLEWIGNAYEGDGAARDRAQELRNVCDKADAEPLECVAGLQQCPKDSVTIFQGNRGNRNKQMLYTDQREIADDRSGSTCQIRRDQELEGEGSRSRKMVGNKECRRQSGVRRT